MKVVLYKVCFDKVKVYLAFKPVWSYSTQSNNYVRYNWVKKNVKGLKTPTGMNKKTTEFGFRVMWRITCMQISEDVIYLGPQS